MAAPLRVKEKLFLRNEIPTETQSAEREAFFKAACIYHSVAQTGTKLARPPAFTDCLKLYGLQSRVTSRKLTLCFLGLICFQKDL